MLPTLRSTTPFFPLKGCQKVTTCTIQSSHSVLLCRGTESPHQVPWRSTGCCTGSSFFAFYGCFITSFQCIFRETGLSLSCLLSTHCKQPPSQYSSQSDGSLSGLSANCIPKLCLNTPGMCSTGHRLGCFNLR